MKKLLLTFLVFSTVMISCNDKRAKEVGTGTEQNIQRSADSMMSAFKRKDWMTFTRYNHPAMTKIMGGQRPFAAFLAQQMNLIPDTAIKRMEASKVLQVVKTDKDLQCVVEQKMEMHLEGTKITRTTYLIGESLDLGKTWTFFDASSDALPLKKIKPNISPELKIPAKKQEMEKL